MSVELFIMIKRKNEGYREDLHMSIDVMKDKKLKLRDLHDLHTLGCAIVMSRMGEIFYFHLLMEWLRNAAAVTQTKDQEVAKQDQVVAHVILNVFER